MSLSNTFKFNSAVANIGYAKGKYILPFTSIWNGNVTFNRSDLTIMGRTTINKDQTEVTVTMNAEGGNSTRTFTLTAITIPDWNVEAIYQHSTANQVVVKPTKVQYIEYAIADDTEVTISGDGSVTWPNNNQYHKLLLKFKDGYDGAQLFQNFDYIKSARICVENVGAEMFESCSDIEEVAFMDGCKTIGEDCCLYATHLKKVFVSQTVTAIEDRAFARTNLNALYLYQTERPYWGDMVFDFETDDQPVVLYGIRDDGDYLQEIFDEISEQNTCNISLLPYPEEGTEYDMRMSLDYGDPFDALTYKTQYQQNQVGQITSVISLYQAPTVILQEKNICDNITITFPANSQEYISYRILANNEVIFVGKVLAFDDEVTIKLNSIIEQHIPVEFIFPQRNRAERYWNYNLFEVEYSYDDWQTYQQLNGVIKVYADWAYYVGLKTETSNNLIKEVAEYEPIIETYELHKGESATTVIYNTLVNNADAIVRTSQFEQCSFIVHANPVDKQSNIKVKAVKIVTTIGTKVITHIYPIKRDSDGNIVQKTNKRLYIRNKLGGFDTIYFNRASQESDSFTIQNYSQNSSTDNSLLQKQSLKQITHNWKAKTDWISEDNTRIVQDMFASTQVFLDETEKFTTLNFSTNVTPVNITTTKADRKTYYSNGRKFNQYTFDIELQTKQKFI